MDDVLVALLQRREQDHLKLALTSLNRKTAAVHYEMANKCREGVTLLAEKGEGVPVWSSVPALGTC